MIQGRRKADISLNSIIKLVIDIRKEGENAIYRGKDFEWEKYCVRFEVTNTNLIFFIKIKNKKIKIILKMIQLRYKIVHK